MSASALLDGSSVLVTGASAGIGRALASELAPRAAQLILLARRGDRLEAVAEQLRVRHRALRVHAVACDLADAGQLDALLARLGEDLPAPDVLIANAGVGQHGAFANADWTRVEQLLAVNVTASTRLLHAVLPHMLERRRGGLLVIGSGAGLALMPNAAAYTASKHYLHGLTQSLRAELDGTGVTVTEVCPGPVNTDFDTAAGIPQTTGGPGGWLRITAEQCAAEALAGFERGQPLIFPGRAYRTLMRVAPLAPLRAQRFAVTRATRRSRAPRDPAPKRTPTRRPTERPNPPGMGAALRVLVVGATGKLGQAIVRQALHRGHAVTALTREPQAVAQLPALRVLRGDVLAPETLDAALAGQNAVICALGTPSPRKPSTLLHDGTQNLIDAMNRTGVRRLVCVTLLGVGESHRNASLTYRKLIFPMLSPMLPDKQRQEDAIGASDLEWVIVRPPRFVGGKPTGTAQIIPDGQPGRVGKVIREDLASILLDLATNDQFVRHTVIVGSRRT